MGRWASLSAGVGEGHYRDQLFREWLQELPGEIAGPAEWCNFGSPWGRPQRPSRMEHLHLEELLGEGSTCGDSLSSQHQAGRILRLRKGPQEEAGSVACICVDETFLSTSCLVPHSWRMELELPHQSRDLGEAPMSQVNKRSRASAQHHLDVGQEGA